jgi:hypothetical protein
MKKRQKLLTDKQGELIGLLLSEPKRRRDGRGRPPAEPRLFRGHSVGFANGGRYGAFCPRVSLAVDLPEAAEALGRGGIW